MAGMPCSCCRCNCGCSLETCLGHAYNAASTGDEGQTDYEVLKTGAPFDTAGVRRRCARLFVWNCAYWTADEDGNNAYVVNESCLKIIVTKRDGGGADQNAYDAPFYQDGRFSGTLLDFLPYFYPLCGGSGIGGWALGGSWWRPTADNLKTIYNVLAADLGGSMPTEGQRHTLILLMRFGRWTDWIDGLGVTHGTHTEDEDSRATLMAVHATCPKVGT